MLGQQKKDVKDPDESKFIVLSYFSFSSSLGNLLKQQLLFGQLANNGTCHPITVTRINGGNGSLECLKLKIFVLPRWLF